eukprot:TRINITY_DN599_c0_g2_i1.p1 TRINITY_DN599_c0_g2~~TRINITY_DN599_c0_g2_i1.p1  ORF type:complete len:485 (-),score=93.62 TRINITY_DN599_c0_g2_i1:36-1490(-)
MSFNSSSGSGVGDIDSRVNTPTMRLRSLLPSWMGGVAGGGKSSGYDQMVDDDEERQQPQQQQLQQEQAPPDPLASQEEQQQQQQQQQQPSPPSFYLTQNQCLALLLGQVLSLLITGTGISSQFLVTTYHINMPTAQSFLNYCLLALIYLPVLWWRGALAWDKMRSKVPLYMALSFVDVEANYLVVKAYQYTSITSVMLLDCFSIPCVMALSFIFLRTRFHWNHSLSVLMCLAGLALLVASDAMYNADHSKHGDSPVLGDILCLCGAALYAVSNVGQEYAVVKYERFEYLGMIGLFGTIVSGVQLIVLERNQLAGLFTAFNWDVGMLLLAFNACMFSLYSLTPTCLRLGGATLLNLSLLTSDALSVLAGVLLFQTELSVMYFVSFGTIVFGLVLYNMRATRRDIPSVSGEAGESFSGNGGGGSGGGDRGYRTDKHEGGSADGAGGRRIRESARFSCVEVSDDDVEGDHGNLFRGVDSVGVGSVGV